MNRQIVPAILFLITFFALACSRRAAVKEDHSGHKGAVKENNQMGNMIHLTRRDEQYANIRVDTVRKRTIAEYSTLLGITTFDERKITVITSRIRGRLDKLFVRNPQQSVGIGQALYSIYSEELLSYENEFLNASQQQEHFSTMKPVADQLVESSRKKLLLWGLTEEQVAEMEKTRIASPLITFYSPVSGTLTELSVSEGQYVDIGQPLYRIADLSHLWVEAQIYANELKWLYEKPAVTVEFDSYPNESFDATPVFDNPTIEADQKITLVRFLISNPKFQLKPGMMAYVNIKRNEKRTLVIPKSSILVGSMITVWVKPAEGMYESRMVEVGIQNKKEVEVVNGLTEGELVVTSGAYLLNSALILQKGSAMPGMEGMKM